ncbi:hypothetical protein F5Y05DRAFT_347421 [Hypoxylon sp. FL0543]|nr:hypothetical protein F5Y05DRAFT_347421 [Hypoxylon sp. FL0543]
MAEPRRGSGFLGCSLLAYHLSTLPSISTFNNLGTHPPTTQPPSFLPFFPERFRCSNRATTHDFSSFLPLNQPRPSSCGSGSTCRSSRIEGRPAVRKFLDPSIPSPKLSAPDGPDSPVRHFWHFWHSSVAIPKPEARTRPDRPGQLAKTSSASSLYCRPPFSYPSPRPRSKQDKRGVSSITISLPSLATVAYLVPDIWVLGFGYSVLPYGASVSK